MTETKPVVQILEDAVDLMDTEKIQWCSGTLAHGDGKGGVSACAVGILYLASELEIKLTIPDLDTGAAIRRIPKGVWEAIEEFNSSIIGDSKKHMQEAYGWSEEQLKKVHKDNELVAEVLVEFNDAAFESGDFSDLSDDELKQKANERKQAIRDIFMRAAKGLRERGES